MFRYQILIEYVGSSFIGWQVQTKPGRLAARKGVIGRVGPPIIHIGLILGLFEQGRSSFLSSRRR